jgi:glycosyltransferase involved in cell wall biosynthesis
MMRILFVNLHSRIAGAETSLILLAKFLRARFNLHAACPPAAPLSQLLAANGVTSHALPQPPRRSFRSPLTILYWLRTSFRVLRIVRAVRPQVIHANSFTAAAASIAAAVFTRTSLILHARDINTYGWFTRLVTRLCRTIIPVSHFVAAALLKTGVDAKKLVIIHNGVEISPQKCHTDAAGGPLADWGDDTAFVFANVGQFVPWKRQDLFIEAASRAAHAVSNTRFVLVGDDVFGRDAGYAEKLRLHAARCGLGNKIRIFRWQEDMTPVWQVVDCLVHTAIAEPFGRVVIEAMAHGVTVLVTAGGGPSEIVRNGITGVVVADDGNPQTLSDAMIALACNRPLVQRLVGAAYEQVVSEFSAEKTAAAVGEIYQQTA